MSKVNILSELGVAEVFRNLSFEQVRKHEIDNGEVVLADNGAVVVDTGIYTGRSPKDKYFVEREPSRSKIDWGGFNQPVSPDIFDEAFALFPKYLGKKNVYVFDGYIGTSKRSKKKVRVISERAWIHHFCLNMLLTPDKFGESYPTLDSFQPEFTWIHCPSIRNPKWQEQNLNSDVFVMIDLERKLGLIAGTEYSGEVKKGCFTLMNYWLPEERILPMHCSATRGRGPVEESVLYFGLSGTGKTTLSADPERNLIGDDEHGWDNDGVFNFEGGCYAKVINLDPSSEPDIYNAIKENAILENVILDERKKVDYSDGSKTENTRVSYPIEHIRNWEPSRRGTHPHAVIFLACDAFGVLPPVAKLTPEQAMYHFVQGYSAKVAGTERGVKEPQATFSHCFGAPFMVHSPRIYADLLREKILKHNSHVYLVNTGWTGGPYGVGQRMKLRLTRQIISAIISNELANVEYNEPDPIFQLRTPKSVKRLEDPSILDPRSSWKSPEEYEKTAQKLANMFHENFVRKGFASGPEKELEKYGPKWKD
ncbi:hypothetical protein GpartN1_g6735.t1 [Galdieria partita]|uniref:phosphoenolpyruvate carboxykinase (ATP) n=1 Tax=Galdieria partita TaxID=83374 RepID=A0A9C7Q340_9RHOD|nr:hypothetical protein GpartN1_g6735.t1 [Galdieria partita]